MSKKNKGKLTYFLDHPQIKRHKSPGNGESPGFFNQLASGKLANPSGGGSKPAETSGSMRARKPASTSTSSTSQSSWQKAFSKGFKGE